MNTTKNTHCRAAIVAYFVPPTNTKPARIRVKTQRGSTLFPFDDGGACDHADPFIRAVAAYLEKIRAEDQKAYGPGSRGWGSISEYSIGHLPTGEYVFVANT